MYHWRLDFVNRPLSRPLYVAVRWARLMELCAAVGVRYRLSRLGLLCDIEVDLERVDAEEEHNLLATAMLTPLARATGNAAEPPCGVWV